jgi:hypothetical protein
MKKIIPFLLLFIGCKKLDTLNSRAYVAAENIQAGGVVRAYPLNVVGSVIPWKFIVDAGHDKVYFDSVVAQPSGAVRIYYPEVDKIISFTVVGDEILSKSLTFGSSVDMKWADVFIGQYVTNGGELRGSNGNTWSITGCPNWLINYDTTTGLTRLNIGTPNNLVVTANDYARLQIVYKGSNIRFVKWQFSALGSYNAGFYLTDYLGNIIKGKMPTSERVVVTSNPTIQNVNCYKVSGDSSQLKLFTPTANFWVSAQFIKK